MSFFKPRSVMKIVEIDSQPVHLSFAKVSISAILQLRKLSGALSKALLSFTEQPKVAHEISDFDDGKVTKIGAPSQEALGVLRNKKEEAIEALLDALMTEKGVEVLRNLVADALRLHPFPDNQSASAALLDVDAGTLGSLLIAVFEVNFDSLKGASKGVMGKLLGRLNLSQAPEQEQQDTTTTTKTASA